MTTIATDGKSMAADGMINSRGTITDRAFPKVVALKDGRIVGVAGSAYNATPFRDWLLNGGDAPNLHDDFEALVLHPNGEVRSYDKHCRCIEEQPMTAIGSGMDFAIGALEAGCSPREAVEIAARRDTCTGGKITELKL